MASSESLHRFANVDDEIVPQGQSGDSLLALCSQTRNTNEADTKQSAMRKNVSKGVPRCQSAFLARFSYTIGQTPIEGLFFKKEI